MATLPKHPPAKLGEQQAYWVKDGVESAYTINFILTPKGKPGWAACQVAMSCIGQISKVLNDHELMYRDAA